MMDPIVVVEELTGLLQRNILQGHAVDAAHSSTTVTAGAGLTLHARLVSEHNSRLRVRGVVNSICSCPTLKNAATT